MKPETAGTVTIDLDTYVTNQKFSVERTGGMTVFHVTFLRMEDEYLKILLLPSSFIITLYR